MLDKQGSGPSVLGLGFGRVPQTSNTRAPWQWIYAIAPQLSSYPSQFDIDITVEQIGLPHNATLTVHHMAAEGGEESLMMDGILDSKCMTPWSGTASGAMLLILDMPPGGSHGCHEECIQVRDGSWRLHLIGTARNRGEMVAAAKWHHGAISRAFRV